MLGSKSVIDQYAQYCELLTEVGNVGDIVDELYRAMSSRTRLERQE